MPARELCALTFDAPVVKVKAVSPARAKKLEKLGITTVRQLIENYPNRYIDLGECVSIAEAQIGSTVTIVGTVDSVNEKQPRRRMHILEVGLVDDTGVLMGVWFRQPWLAKRFERGMRVALSGKVLFEYGFKRMNAPFIEVLGTEAGGLPTERMIPVHPTTEGISSTWMRRFIANALEQVADFPDPLSPWLRAERGLMSKKAALRAIHFPRDVQQCEQARRRLAYEEVLNLQLAMLKARRDLENAEEPVVHAQGSSTAALRASLPFTLTSGQEATISEIFADMCASRIMNRMLLGDVGCGKTIVAAFALALAADTGSQAAMMAPTEVLARQYSEKLGELLEGAGVSFATLTGSTPKEERVCILEGLANGKVQVVFGTHALIEPDVVFAHLSLVVIDEQHRFGVSQRAALRAKGSGCDLLTMTATPIPRTLALTLYGDLDTSVIRMRPQERPPTTTRMISRDERGVGYDAVRAAVQAGRQAYIICPLVGLSREQRAACAESGQLQESLAGGADVSDAKAAETEAAFLQAKVFPGYKVGLLTGRMSAAEKQQVMGEFRAGAIQVLVATTVVEVGVDVPNATVMIIEDAERFGLAQLHQLRGRVGRGTVAGEVFLVADPGADDSNTRARMEAICSTDDGFALAEADLKARREGDVLGLRQHGQGVLKLVNVVDDADLVQLAHDDAKRLLEGASG